MTGRRVVPPAAALAVVLAALPGVARAHAGALGNTDPVSLPSWLFFLTGGGVVVASFLFSTFVTDPALVRAIHERGPTVRTALPRALGRLAGALAVPALLAVVAVGLLGPADPLANAAVLVVWVGWWAGYAMTTYLVGNTWPAINPWRTVAEFLPSLGRSIPDRWGSWPAVAGLLALVWLEVVSPLADDPRLLAGVVVAYTLVTVGGAVAVGPEAWFRRVDPVARVFRWYGRVAPLQYENGRLAVRAPGSALTDAADRVARPGDVAFVVALLWVTTYDGLVGTPTWRDLAAPLVAAGVPPMVLYPLALVVGFGVFLGAYRLAAAYGRRYAESYLASGAVARRFAPSLLAIAAGYHLAHYLGYFLALLPMLGGALLAPLAPPSPAYLVLPGWFGGLELAFVLAGHLLAIWVAHATAYDLFPGRMQAVRSQYPLTAVMIFYTMTSLLIVSQPAIAPPFLG